IFHHEPPGDDGGPPCRLQLLLLLLLGRKRIGSRRCRKHQSDDEFPHSLCRGPFCADSNICRSCSCSLSPSWTRSSKSVHSGSASVTSAGGAGVGVSILTAGAGIWCSVVQRNATVVTPTAMNMDNA